MNRGKPKDSIDYLVDAIVRTSARVVQDYKDGKQIGEERGNLRVAMMDLKSDEAKKRLISHPENLETVKVALEMLRQYESIDGNKFNVDTIVAFVDSIDKLTPQQTATPIPTTRGRAETTVEKNEKVTALIEALDTCASQPTDKNFANLARALSGVSTKIVKGQHAELSPAAENALKKRISDDPTYREVLKEAYIRVDYLPKPPAFLDPAPAIKQQPPVSSYGATLKKMAASEPERKDGTPAQTALMQQLKEKLSKPKPSGPPPRPTTPAPQQKATPSQTPGASSPKLDVETKSEPTSTGPKRPGRF